MLLEELTTRATGLRLEPGWIEKVRVRAMPDSGMGSFEVAKPTGAAENRSLGRVAAELTFYDVDGVLVTVTLNTDADDELFEVDVWKTDFTPVARIPSSFAD
jgi:hypothetical protein